MAIILVIGLAVGWSIYFFSFINVQTHANVTASIQSCNSNGGETLYFSTGDPVYAKGTNFDSGTYNIYIVAQNEVCDGMPLSGSAIVSTTVSVGSSGTFTEVVWPSATHGSYYIIVDYNPADGPVKGDGMYNAGDLLGGFVNGTSGVFVAPEYEFGALLALAACFAAFIVVKRKSLPSLKQ